MKKEEAIEKIKTELKLNGSSNLTIRNYLWFVEKFLGQTDKSIEELNEDDVKAYLASLIDNKSRSTVSLAASSLKFFFSKILNKSVSGIDLPKKEEKLPEVLTKDEVDKIIQAAETKNQSLS